MLEKDDPRKKESYADAVRASALLGGTTAGVTGYISYLTSNGFFSRPTMEVGGAVTLTAAGLLSSVVSSTKAEEHAIRGNTTRALLNEIRAGIESTVGFGSASVTPSFEMWGVKGAIIASCITASLGAFSIRSIGELRNLSNAYKKLIFPLKDARNYVGLRVVNHEQFTNYEVNLPPVYRSATFEDMIVFRTLQLEKAKEGASSLQGRLKSPDRLIERLLDAVFVIPNVSHQPEPTDNMNELNGTRSMGLIDDENNKLSLDLIVTDGTKDKWPFKTIFTYPLFGSDTEVWNYLRKKSWKSGVVVYVKRGGIHREKIGGDDSLPSASDKYFLLDILKDPTGRIERKKTEKVEKNRFGIPGLNPREI